MKEGKNVKEEVPIDKRKAEEVEVRYEKLVARLNKVLITNSSLESEVRTLAAIVCDF